MVPSLLAASPSSASDMIMPDDLTPRSLASLICMPLGMVPPGKHDAHSLPGRDVGSSAHDGARLSLAHVDDAHRQLVGVGVALTSRTLPTTKRLEVVALGRHAHQRDPLDLGPGEGQT